MPFSSNHSFNKQLTHHHINLLNLVPLLTHLTSNNYTKKELFSFAEEEPSFNCAHKEAHYMTIFDIEFLFTNISFE